MLRYPQKFLLISLLFLLPLAVTMGFMVSEQNVRIRFGQREIAGTLYLRALGEVYAGALRYRHEALRGIASGIPVDAELAAARSAVDQGLADLAALEAQVGADLGTSRSFAELQQTWRLLRDDPLTRTLEVGYVRHGRFINQLRGLITLVGDRSNLILDPELDSYYVMDAVLLRLPEAQALIAHTLLLSEGLVPEAALRTDPRTELVMSASLLRANTDTLQRNLMTAYTSTSSETLAAQLEPAAAAHRSAVAAMLARYYTASANPSRQLGTPELSATGQGALATANALSQVASPALEALLQSRIETLQRRQSFTVAFAMLLVAVAFFLGLQLMRNISRPLDRLLKATGRLAGGDLTARVQIEGESEVAQVGRAFNLMAQELQTGREQLEQRVTERTRALAAATREAQEARIAAEAATRAKSAFLANMSHELRTPLNAIIGYSEMLQEEAEEQGYGMSTSDLEKIRTAGKHLLTLINDILDLSKIEAGRMELHLERFSLAALLDEVLSTIAPLVERGGNTLEVRGEASGELYADMTKLRQALLNLLSNAAKFTQGGRITLTIDSLPGEAGELLRLQVSDTGIGMSREELGRLFREFTQGDTSTTRRYGGTGLGLALSRRFCQMMGGDITVTSTPGVGSTFTIVMPREVGALQDDLTAAESELHDLAAELVGPTRGMVLVIDDDPATQDLLRRTLAREGMRVAVAATGEDGLERARALRPDVITLDVLLRGADGWQVLAALKADPQLAAIPVVMLTIMDERNTGFALGAADYLTKPIDRRRLVELVKRHCNNGQPGEGATGDVLIVEDDQPTREMLVRTLTQAGWRTRSAENGLIGLAQVAAAHPGLIILDLMLPELDGFGFLAELRTNPAWATVPVVVVTAMELSAEERAQLSHSAQQVLQKGSYDRDSLLREVRAVVAAQLRPSS